ncbi:MAG TPA: hypothetical protein ENN87_10180 [Phycisphaerales bacterium]|nr:hypothetical protein [Phycisphaerales bacterium]
MMRRQLSLLLFLAIVLSSVASALLVAVTAHREMTVLADEHIDQLHAQLRDRFYTFDLLLAEHETRLDALSARHDISHVFIIDRSGRVVNTDFAPDMGLMLVEAGEGMARIMARLRGSGEVSLDRFNASVLTGRLFKYAYYGPRGRDHIVEVSVDLRDYLDREASPRWPIGRFMSPSRGGATALSCLARTLPPVDPPTRVVLNAEPGSTPSGGGL